MTPDEQSIRNLIDLWHSATAAGDVDTVLSLMTEDVVFLSAGQPPMRGRETFATGLRGLLSHRRIESTFEVQEIIVSGDLAYAWTQLRVRIITRENGEAISREGNALSILRREADGAWRVTRDANMLALAS
jgi:uncharacterized protein (TIGR02246 family)